MGGDTQLGCPLFFFSQLRHDCQQHGHIAGGASDHIGDRFRHENACRAQTKAAGQNTGERHNDHSLPKEREEDGVPFFAQRFKGRLPCKLQGHEDKSKEICVQSGDRVGHESAVPAENADEKGRK